MPSTYGGRSMHLTPSSTVRAPRGMVCSVDHLASAAGVDVLRDGGSGADAAIATSAVLAVTTQHMCGMGGDLFALVHEGAGPPLALNASGRAGSGADAGRLRDEGHSNMPFRDDVRSAPVPGCIDGWAELHARCGRLPLGRVLRAATDYAEHGFPATPLLVGAHERVAGLPGAGDYDDVAPLRPGTIVRRPGAARTLRALAEGGRAAVFGGDYGDDLLEVGAGEYDRADLDRSQAEWVEPISAEAFGHTVWTIPPNSQGYLAAAGAAVASRLDLPDDPDDERWAHLLVEAAKQVGHDRPEQLFDGADGAALLGPDRLDAQAAAVDRDTASTLPLPTAGGGTIYLCTADRDGQAVSLIQSNASGWGSHVVLPRTRIFLHNRGIGFSLDAGHPAEYRAGRRPPHTLAPTIVTRPDGRLRAVVGTMGGDAQPQIVEQLLVRLLRHGQTPGAAVASARWMLTAPGATGFDTWAEPARLRVAIEGHAAETWDGGLARRGHPVDRAEPWSTGFGHAHVITAEDGHLAGASDPRALTGAAIGW
ncbi:MAG: gamma-glutamyltransferase [Actinomycetota bacterium]